MRDALVNTLVGLTVVGELVCIVGLLVGRRAIDRLHYAGAAMTVVPPFLAGAVVIENGGKQPAVNAIVTAGLMLVLGGVLNHATGRLIRSETEDAR